MPTPKHPLRTIRAATPWAGSVAEFARALGVPAEELSAAERGKSLLTARLAARIREVTGACDAALLAGRAATENGKRFTAESFTAWQGSAEQLAEHTRRESQQRALAAGWMEIAGSLELGPEEVAAVEQALVPWQTCEFASAPAAQWKRLTENLQQRTGWTPALPFSAKTRLTLSVQSAPPWDPAAPPPGQSAGNADLFPPCCFTVAAGSGGCRMAAAFWQAVCREHGIGEGDGVPLHGEPTGNWRGFFRNADGRCIPHAVFAGMEENEAAPLRGHPFDGSGILTGGDEHSLTPQVMEFMHQFSADAGSPAGIMLFASLEGGTASALTGRLLGELRAQFPSVPLLVAGVLPLPGTSHIPAAPWHVALAMQAIRTCADAAILFCNSQLITQARRDWHIPAPGYADANLLIAEALTSFTAPLRFGGTDAPPATFAALLDCFAKDEDGRLPIISGSVLPLSALIDRRLRRITLPQLHAALSSAAFPSPDEVECAALCLKVRALPRSEWVLTREALAVKPPDATAPGTHASAAVFAEMPAITRTLRRLQREARAVWNDWQAGRLPVDPGVPPAVLQQAINALA